MGSAKSADPLTELLQKMEVSGKAFQAMTANVKWISHTAVINDDSEETGSVILRRSKGRVQGKFDVTQPDAKVYYFHDRKALVYLPKIKTVQVYDLDKHADQLDQFFLLGFGTTGSELQKSYAIKLIRREMLQGQSTSVLELLPKSKEVKEMLTKVELWIPDGLSYPLQQKLFQSSGDYRLVTYSNIAWNPAMDEHAVELKIPPGVKEEHPQR